MKTLARVAAILLAVIIPITCILGSGIMIARLPDLYSVEFARLRSIEKADVKVEPEVMGQLFSDYINGKIPEFQITAEYAGESRELFTPKERQHMLDVKNLVDKLTIAVIVSFCLFLAGTLFLILKNFRLLLRKSYKWAVVVFAGILFILGMTMVADFTAGFTLFHEMFFTNDLWMLNPDTDILLMIMPEKFFAEAAMVVLLTAIAIFSVIGLIIWRFSRERNMFHIG